MRRRSVVLLVVGRLIIGGATASTAIQLECNQCGGEGKIECSACRGFGALRLSPIWVECGCRGERPHCPICGGRGGYPSLRTGYCEQCEGKGGKPCLYCGGDGGIRANEKLLRVLRLK